MIYLIISILSTSSIYLVFKWFEKKEIRLFEAIVTNYLMASIIGLVNVPDLKKAVDSALLFPIWTIAGLAVGCFFISVFYFIALSSQKVGVSVTTVASKMSLALAVILFALFDPTEHITLIKGIAILLAIGGVVFASLKNDGTSFQWKYILYPMIILIGSTIIDFVLGFFSAFATNASEENLFSTFPFMVSFCIGILMIAFKFRDPNYRVRWKDIGAGVLLGSINFISIFTLVKSYTSGIMSKSALLPVNNLAIVLVGSAAAFFFFKEKLSLLNKIGIALSVIALLLLLLV